MEPDMLDNIDRNSPHEIVVRSPYGPGTVKAALARAAFLLRKEGNGPYDAQQAAILETVQLEVRT